MYKVLEKIQDVINNLFARGTVTLVDDEKNIQKIQGIFGSGETLDSIERFQDYGFASNPLPGAEAITLFVGGRRSQGLVIKVDDRRYRLKGLKSGEVALFTDEGDVIHLKRGNVIDFKTKTLNIDASTIVNIKTPSFNVDAANAEFTGNVKTLGDSDTDGMVKAKSGVFASGYNPYTPGAPNSVVGDLEVSGEVKDATGNLTEIRTTFNTHKHSETNSAAGTSVPDKEM